MERMLEKILEGMLKRMLENARFALNTLVLEPLL